MEKQVKWEEFQNPILSEEEMQNDGQLMVSQFGSFVINNKALINRLFNLEIMHTNFDITPLVVNLIQNINGIEGLEPISRYRLRIAFAKMFDKSEVKDDIENVLLKEELPLDLQNLQNSLDKQHKFWAIAVLDTKEKKFFGGNAQKEVEDKISVIKNIDRVYTSWRK